MIGQDTNYLYIVYSHIQVDLLSKDNLCTKPPHQLKYGLLDLSIECWTPFRFGLQGLYMLLSAKCEDCRILL